MPERHDGSYRLLFSHPRMVEDLLRGFLRVEAGEDLVSGSLERRSEVRISDRLVRREQDLVWMLRGPRGKPRLYLLLEFQSEADPQMSLRISIYEGLLRQDLTRSREVRGSEVPPVLAVVIYNGERRWTERSRTQYRLIDVQRDPLPADPDNLVAQLFELERSRPADALVQPVEKLAALLAGSKMADLRRSFNTFLRESLLPGRFPEARIPAMLDLEEVRPMLRQRVMEWTREWEQNGVRKGEAMLLIRQLEFKFGPLQPGNLARIDAADSEQLLQWGERVLAARSVEEVFGN
jgi:hypothetical protein